MNVHTGEVMSYKQFELHKKLYPDDAKHWKPVKKQAVRAKTGRNELCPCGSNKKFKRCCYRV